MTQFINSPCADHRTCTLDLKRLRAETKGTMAPLFQELNETERRLTELDTLIKKAAADKAPNLKELQAESQAANQKRWFLNTLCLSSEGKTYICTLKAHHKGRLHGTKRRLPDGAKIEWTLEAQAEYLRTGRLGQWQVFRYASMVLERYQKAPVAVTKVA